MPEETESGRWRHLEIEMTRAALTHAATVLRSAAHDLVDEELRQRLLKAAQRLDDESHSVRMV